MAAVSRAPACLDPGVTGGHSCSDSLCKHPLPAGPPPTPAGQRAPWAPRPGPQGLPTGAIDHPADRAGPPALEWKPLLDSLRPAGETASARGSRERHGSVLSALRAGRGLAGVGVHVQEKSPLLSALLTPWGCAPPLPQAGPCLGHHHPRPPLCSPAPPPRRPADPRQRAIPACRLPSLSSGPTLHPRPEQAGAGHCQTRLRSPTGIPCNPVSSVSSALLEAGHPGQGPSLSPSSPLPFSPAFPPLSDHLCSCAGFLGAQHHA